MKNFLKKILPKKKRFSGIDIGSSRVKAAEIKIIDGFPEVVSLIQHPSPPGVWTEQFDEEGLVSVLKESASPQLKEAITCIGGEKLISRIVHLPKMADKELEGAARLEIGKFVPTPVSQLIIRQVRLNKDITPVKPNGKKDDPARADAKKEPGDGRKKGQNVLLLAVPMTTVYQYYSIFSRAGLVVTAVDFQAFALWRLFGRSVQGAVAVADIGEKSSQLVIVKDGLIDFIRLLPTGCQVLTNYIMNTYGVEDEEARKIISDYITTGDSTGEHLSDKHFDDLENELHGQVDADVASGFAARDDAGAGGFLHQELTKPVKEVAAASALEKEQLFPGFEQASNILREGLQEITKELQRSLSFYSNQENLSVEKLILSGGAVKIKGLADALRDSLEIDVEVGVPEVDFAEGVSYDPAFAVAIGLALREVVE